MKKTKNFHFLGKKKYETKFNNPIFLMDSNDMDEYKESDMDEYKERFLKWEIELDENDNRREEDVYAYRRRERYLKQKMTEYKEALNKIKHLLESRLAADGSDYFEIDQFDDNVLDEIYGLSKVGDK